MAKAKHVPKSAVHRSSYRYDGSAPGSVRTIEFTPNETGVIPWDLLDGVCCIAILRLCDTPRSHPRACYCATTYSHRGTACPEKKRPTNSRTYKVRRVILLQDC